jgi:guanyl-specific ribonuclease Sa
MSSQFVEDATEQQVHHSTAPAEPDRRSRADGAVTADAGLLQLQRSVGNRAVVELIGRGRQAVIPPNSLTVQRAVRPVGDAGAAPVPAQAAAIAAHVLTEAAVRPGGAQHLANIQGRGFPGFLYLGIAYAGGRVFNNRPMPDRTTLPPAQTYQEWDITPCRLGQARDTLRVVTSNTGNTYYSADHYDNFTQFP